jgi:gp16 family phage-associated protein
MKKSRQGIKTALALHGMTLRDWARAHGFKEALVYRVVSGEQLPTRGESLLIAVKLGLVSDLPQETSPALLADLKRLGRRPLILPPMTGELP